MASTDSKKRGLHILLDLHGCDLSSAPATQLELEVFKKTFIEYLTVNRLTAMGTLVKLFGPHAFSLVVGLAESHISIHTWPEDQYVSADIFVCNYSRDNSKAAQAIADYLIAQYKPADIVRREIER